MKQSQKLDGCAGVAGSAAYVLPINPQLFRARSERFHPAFAAGFTLYVDCKLWRTDPSAEGDVCELLDWDATAFGEVNAVGH